MSYSPIVFNILIAPSLSLCYRRLLAFHSNLVDISDSLAPHPTNPQCGIHSLAAWQRWCDECGSGEGLLSIHVGHPAMGQTQSVIEAAVASLDKLDTENWEEVLSKFNADVPLWITVRKSPPRQLPQPANASAYLPKSSIFMAYVVNPSLDFRVSYLIYIAGS